MAASAVPTAQGATRPVVALIYGGASGEHDASRLSAAQVLQHIDRDRWTPMLLGVSRDGRWHRVDGIDDLDRAGPGPALPDLEGIDIAFPLIHGHNGEDGTLQGMLEMAGVPYVGCGVLASAIGMDKEIARRLFAAAGIPTIPTKVITPSNRGDAELEAQRLGYPVFVKPNQSGTSVGVSKVDEPALLSAALNEAFRHDSEVLLQPKIVGREVEVGILQHPDGRIEVSPALQVQFDEQFPFLTYDAKYTPGGEHYEIPAPLGNEQSANLTQYAETAFTAIHGDGFARVDFFVADDGRVLVNEINTVPGLTAFSHYPMMWAAVGRSMTDVITVLCERAVAARPNGRTHVWQPR